MKKGIKALLPKCLAVSASLALALGSAPAGIMSGLFTSTITASAANSTVTSWSQLQSAFDNGGTVKLGANITSSASDDDLSIESGVTVVLDLNGKTLSRSTSAESMVIYNEGDLTIKDSGGSGVITGSNSNNSAAIDNDGTLTITGGTISGNSGKNFGGGLVNYGTAYINGGKITNNTANYGAGIYNFGTLYVNGGEISSNTALSGSGINNDNGNLYLYGGTITSNVAKGDSKGKLCGGVESNKRFHIKGSPKVTQNVGWNNSYGTSTTNRNIVTTGIDLDGPVTGAKLGVYVTTASTVTKGWSAYMGTAAPSTVFSSDNSSYTVTTSGGEAYFKTGSSSSVTNYIVSYDANGGTGSMAGTTVESGTSITLPACTFKAPSGKTFDKWSINGTLYDAGASVKITAQTTVKATWRNASAFTVTFDSNGGSGTMASQSVTEGSSYTLPACTFTAPSGKTFDKWSINGTTYSVGASVKITANTTVKATWKSSTTNYVLTFDSNGGSGSMTARAVTAGTSYKLPSCAFTAPSGKVFDKWQVGSQYYAVGDSFTVNANTTIKAIWKDTASTVIYTLTFNSNGGSGTMASQSVPAGKYTLPACTFTAPEGKEFNKWQIGVSSYAAGTEVTISADTTIRATWKNKTTTNYTITFNSNGGSGTMASQSVPAGKYTLPACTFTAPEGKEFNKWQIGVSTYAAGTEVTISANTTIRATWKDKTVTVLYGDANRDGKVNMQDYVAMQRYLLNPEGKYDIDIRNIDFDDNGVVNMRDYVKMQRKLLES